jgi:hypothetical protein
LSFFTYSEEELSNDSERVDSEEYEESYGPCDSCGQYEATIECSLFDEDIDHGVARGEICEDCCESTFESEPVSCVQNGDDCPRVKHLQLALLKKTAKENNFKKSEKIPEIFANSENTVGIGVFKAKPETTFKDTVIPVDAFYTGSEYDFAKTKQRKYAYSKDFVDQALSILKRMGEEDLEYGILSKSGALIMKGYSAWSVVSGLDLDWPYMLETRDFLENVRNGYAIFEGDVKKEIKLVDLATEANLDWSKLEPSQFEELCRDILGSFESISDCVLTGATGDEGRDIKAKERVETITGVELRNWCVQCKHFPSRSVRRQDIEDLNTLHTRFKFDVYCIMTSGTFGPNAIRLLEEYEKQGYKIKYMDRQFLENRIKQVPSLLEKFCNLGAK